MTNSKSFKIAQKTAFQAKGRQHMAGKVIQRLFKLIYIRTALGKASDKSFTTKEQSVTHTDCVGPL